jgi:hypothetical protein
MAFVRVYGRATPDRAGARSYHGGQTFFLTLMRMCSAGRTRKEMGDQLGGTTSSEGQVKYGRCTFFGHATPDRAGALPRSMSGRAM